MGSKYIFRYDASYNGAWYDKDNKKRINLEGFIDSLPYPLERVIAVSYNESCVNRLFPNDKLSNFGSFDGRHQRFILFKEDIFIDDKLVEHIYLKDLIGMFGFFYENSFYGGYQFTFESRIKHISRKETDVNRVKDALLEILMYLAPYGYCNKDFMIFYDIAGLYDDYHIVSENEVFANGKLLVPIENVLAVEYMAHKDIFEENLKSEYVIRFFSDRFNQHLLKGLTPTSHMKINNIRLSNHEKEELLIELFTNTECEVFLRV